MQATAGTGAGESTSLPRVPTLRRPDRSTLLRTLGLVAIGTLYLVHTLSRWNRWQAAGYDLGIFDQAVRAYAHGRRPYVSIKGVDYLIWGDHFHPIIAVAAPFYWIWDDPRTLLILQVVLVLLSAWPIWRLAGRYLPQPWSDVLVGGYLLGFPIQAMVDHDVHEISFGLPIAAALVEAVDRRAWRPVVLWGLLLLLVREDMGIVLAVLGLVLLTMRGGRRVGAGFVVVGALHYVAVTGWFLPRYAPDGQFAYWEYESLGPDAPSAIVAILTDPLHAAELFFLPPIKTVTMLLLVVPLLGLPLLSRYSLVALPILAERFFSDRERLWGPHFHYQAIIWPFLVLAALHGARNLQRWRATRRLRRGPGASRARLGRTGRILSGVLALSAPLGMLAAPSVWRLADEFSGVSYRQQQRERDLAAARAMIPPDRCVIAEDRLAIRLTKDDVVMRELHPRLPPDYVAVDLAREGEYEPQRNPVRHVREARELGLVRLATFGDVQVWGPREGTGEPRRACVPWYRR